MVMCVVIGCSKRSGRDKDVSFYRIPKVISEKGPLNLLELTKRRKVGYLAAISRVGVTEKRHFISGKLADLEDEFVSVSKYLFTIAIYNYYNISKN